MVDHVKVVLSRRPGEGAEKVNIVDDWAVRIPTRYNLALANSLLTTIIHTGHDTSNIN